jgi:hypothetical protein
MHPRGTLRTHHSSARRLALAAAGLALTLGALPALTGAIPGTTTPARADDLMASTDAQRTGWDPNEAALSPSTVSTINGTPRFTTAVNGQVYAQPLVIDSLNMVIVATENDWVYGIQATGTGAGTILWSKQLGTPFNIAADPNFAKCTDLVPNIGVTGTPAYSDPAAGGTGDVYMFAVVMSGSPSRAHTYMFGIDPTNSGKGNIVQQTRIQGSPSNDSSITFNSTMQMSRPGVLLSGGAVWGAFASHCDFKPYAGYVARVPIGGTTASLWTDESGVSYDQAGIWQSGGGLMQDPQGRIFVISGNGVSPPKTGTPPGQLAESVIELNYNSGTGNISAGDFFSPANAPSLDAADTDFGAGAAVGLPFATSGTSTYSNILAATSKDGRIWLLDRSHLGGREQGPGNGDAALSQITSEGGAWGHPAVFADTSTLTPANAGTANDFLFYIGKLTHLQVFKFGVASSGTPTLANVANYTTIFGFSSGSPAVTSNGTDPTSAVIWAVHTPNSSPSGSGAILYAYSLGNIASTGGTPSPCTSSSPCTPAPIWHSATFTAAKFTIPATSKGWVYVGTRDGHVLGFAAPGTAAAVVGTTATFAQTPVGTTSASDVSIAAQHPVDITGPPTASTVATNATTTASQFTVDSVSKLSKGISTPVTSYPVSLAKGDKLIAHVRFAPASSGGTDGTLSFPTSSTSTPSVDAAMTGDGTQRGLVAETSTVTFPLAPDQGVTDVPVGIVKPELVNITNYGTTPQTVTSVTPPSGPFTATGLPKPGTKIKPGQTVTVQVTYKPASAAATSTSNSSSLTVTGDSGSPATVALQGSSTAAVSQFTVTPSASSTPPTGAPPTGAPTAAAPVVNFGTVAVGNKATAYIYVSNTGNTASTIQGTAPLPAPFAAPLKASPGLPVNASSDLSLPVTFTPTKTGTFTAHYKLTWTDVNGTHTLTVALTGAAV